MDPADPPYAWRSALPVHAEAYEGFGEVQGMLSFDGTQLRLSFQTSDALLGVLKSKPNELLLPLEQLEALSFGLGWFWLMPWVELELNDFRTLSQLPAAKHGRVRLRVRYADRHRARRFVEELRHARAAHVHARLERSIAGHPTLREVSSDVTPMATSHELPNSEIARTTPERRRDLEG